MDRSLIAPARPEPVDEPTLGIDNDVMVRLPAITMTTDLRSARGGTVRPTMDDVARLAGVSLKTVSRVVNGEAGVAEATTERVQAAIASLNFRRNEIARSLRYKLTTSSIGLVIEDLANPFYAALARAVGEVARSHGFLVLSGSSDESEEREREILTAFLGRRVDGLIVVPTSGSKSFLEREEAAGVKLVFVDRPAIGVTADTVLIDNEAGVLTGVRHLFHHGHRRIGYLGDEPGIYTAAERMRGFQQAVRTLGLDADPDLVRQGLHDAAAAEEQALSMLGGEDPPTALFAGNNLITAGVLRALRRRSGAPIGLVGFDDFALADLVDPPVTVVAADAEELGRRAAERLFARLAGGTGPSETEVLPTRLIVRGSGEVRP
jgi:LacI family transcriptional regulator